ncbi:MAG: hypothetical protein U0166_04425 [Acidobacteriota bacterium]
MFLFLSILFFGAFLVCWGIITMHAFKNNTAQGYLCLCPLFVLYYMLAEFEHEKKGLIIAGFVGGFIVGRFLLSIHNLGHLTEKTG